MTITKLPPGTAIGAHDLRQWSSRRLVGRSGLNKKSESKNRKALKKIQRRLLKRKKIKAALLKGVEAESVLIKRPEGEK